MVHLIPLSDAPQGSAEWLEARKKGVGTTDASAAIGLSPWKTPLELWEEKLGQGEEFKGNWFTSQGSAMEPVLRQHYADTFQVEVKNADCVLRHPEYDFVLASPDGFTEDRLTEFKTSASRKSWGDVGTDEIPKHYMIQVQQAMFVTGFEVCDVGVSFAGMEPVYYEVRSDAEIQDLILRDVMEFLSLIHI